MVSFMSEEEVRERLNGYNSAVQNFMIDALNSNICRFKRGCDTVIIINKPELQELSDNAIGLYLSIIGNRINAYVSLNEENNCRDWLNLGEYDVSEKFNAVVTKAVHEAGKCNYCGNYVGYKNIRQVSFAGKSCTKCLPEARAKDEPPGWYN